MGDAVAAALGDAVGDAVGAAAVGVPGDTVGDAVGDTVGDTVGAVPAAVGRAGPESPASKAAIRPILEIDGIIPGMLPLFHPRMLLTGRKFLLSAAACGLVAPACSLLAPKFERPEITVAGIELTGGNLLQQTFLVKFDIRNPNDRELPVRSLHADLEVAGEHVAGGANNTAFVVPANGTTQFDMNITANLGLALLKLTQRPEGGSSTIDYEMTGSASLDLPFLHDLPFHQKGSFALH